MATPLYPNVEVTIVDPTTGDAAEVNSDNELKVNAAQTGEVQASPTTYTVLDRLKALLTGIVLAAGNAIIGKVGIDQTTPGTTNAVVITDASGNDIDSFQACTSCSYLNTNTILAGSQNPTRHVWVNPTNELAVSPVYRMVGTAFDGGTKDTNFWTESTANGGTVVQSGAEIQLETNTTADGYAQYQSVRKARFVAGSAQLLAGAVNWETAATANNIRRVGAYTTDATDDIEDGFFFQFNGTTFGVGYANAGSITTVSTGSFNGYLGATWEPTAGTYYRISIEFTPMGALWYINGILLHSITGTAGFVATNTVNITIENENTSSLDTDIKFNSVGLYIARQGALETNPTSKRVSGTSTTQFKYGAGILRGAIISAVVNGADINIYDGTSNADTLIWASGNLAAKTEPFNIDFYELPFSDGLHLEIADSSADVVLVYE